jgi:hypothetical protein
MKWIGLGTPPAASRDDSASPGASERQVRGKRFMTQRCLAIAEPHDRLGHRPLGQGLADRLEVRRALAVERCRHAYEDEGLVVAESVVVVSVAAAAIQRHRSLGDR